MHQNRIVLVTPLKDEIENLPLLIKTISGQTAPIYAWIIVQNGSADGSKEYLESLINVPNIENLIILDFELPVETYELGFKYSTVVSQGFNLMLEKVNQRVFEGVTHVGICDADCFPSSDYYEKLIAFMDDQKLGISSGIGRYFNGKLDGEASEWVRGNCRLWSFDVFRSAGYLIGPSADALSLAKAQMAGVKTKPNHNLEYRCREMGKKSRYEYYGFANYYRGVSFFYCILKTLNYLRIGQYENGLRFIKGYLESVAARKTKIADKELLTYFNGLAWRKCKRYIRGVFNA